MPSTILELLHRSRKEAKFGRIWTAARSTHCQQAKLEPGMADAVEIPHAGLKIVQAEQLSAVQEIAKERRSGSIGRNPGWYDHAGAASRLNQTDEEFGEQRMRIHVAATTERKSTTLITR